MRCLWQKQGILSEEGEIDVEKLKSGWQLGMKTDKIINECVAVREATPEETAFAYHTCFYKNFFEPLRCPSCR